MTKPQIRTLNSSLSNRINAIVNERIPVLAAKSAETQIMDALVKGRPLKLRSDKEIRKLALEKIIADRYSDSRQFKFTEIFESSDEVKAAQKAAAENERSRERLAVRLSSVKTKIITNAELGKYDADATTALDEFEAKVADLN